MYEPKSENRLILSTQKWLLVLMWTDSKTPKWNILLFAKLFCRLVLYVQENIHTNVRCSISDSSWDKSVGKMSSLGLECSDTLRWDRVSPLIMFPGSSLIDKLWHTSQLHSNLSALCFTIQDPKEGVLEIIGYGYVPPIWVDFWPSNTLNMAMILTKTPQGREIEENSKI